MCPHASHADPKLLRLLYSQRSVATPLLGNRKAPSWSPCSHWCRWIGIDATSFCRNMCKVLFTALRSQRIFLLLLQVAATVTLVQSRTFIDDVGVEHTFDGDRARIATEGHVAISLLHFGKCVGGTPCVIGSGVVVPRRTRGGRELHHSGAAVAVAAAAATHPVVEKYCWLSGSVPRTCTPIHIHIHALILCFPAGITLVLAQE